MTMQCTELPGASAPPTWPHCGHRTTVEEPVGCTGIPVTGHAACLAHLADADRDTYLAGLTPGSDIDHRGTTFTEPLLTALLDALRDPSRSIPSLGTAEFGSAVFEGDADFDRADFAGDARFDRAVFEGEARFREAFFHRGVHFASAEFTDTARFDMAVFEDDADFTSAIFRSGTAFDHARFQDMAGFEAVVFEGDAQFAWASFRSITTFESAAFRSRAGFGRAAFCDAAQFDSATFECGARFDGSTFEDLVRFTATAFNSDVDFGSALFKGLAGFLSVAFEGGARFDGATFKDLALFGGTAFNGEAGFGSVTFEGDVRFDGAGFERPADLGPFVCAGRVGLSGARFGGPVRMSFAARGVECSRTRWSSTAVMRLRHATVDLSHADLGDSLTVAAQAEPFALPGGRTLDERALTGGPGAGAPAAGVPGARVRVASLRGVDTAHLVLADVDLSRCLFTGAVGLDRIRLEGACVFASTPYRSGGPRGGARFTPRRTLAEEHHWRARRPGSARGWDRAVLGAGQAGPAQLAPVYRALRTACEAGRIPAGAADFSYGEMEMRRHDRTGTARAERGLLHGYWLVSGFGLRASRALGWLLATVLTTVVLLMWAGIPQDAPKQEATGSVPADGGAFTFTIEEDGPGKPSGERFTGERFETSLDIALGFVVFRSPGRELTAAGGCIETVSRVSAPLLLGLAALAVRNRVKR
ncbi:pentapeptide repeat-containing protein [Streptomyces sp. EN23]|uniref:pentapeptide repeat-containing protein n=1 Tax=Streptomyces sp. EN23 TaxID=212774 RepID=UPI000AA701BD|nr:pentapeptide repeat-containing protein [Streptomyces sp. EN23]